MIRWEYLVEALDPRLDRARLCELGQVGWELVAVNGWQVFATRPEAQGRWCWFKRPLSSEEQRQADATPLSKAP